MTVEGSPELLHILPTFKFAAGKIQELGAGQMAFAEMVRGKESHVNNFMHDLMGVPYQLDVVAMTQDATIFLENAKRRIDAGLERNEKCLCGSDKKWKHCHGFGKC